MKSAKESRERAGAHYRLTKKLFEKWNLTVDESSALLGIDREKWSAYNKQAALPLGSGAVRRSKLLVHIYHLLGDKYPYHLDVAHAWIKRQNAAPPFLWKSPLEFMCSGGITAIAIARDELVGFFQKCEASTDSEGRLSWNIFKGVYEETPDTLAQIALYIIDDWQLSVAETLSVFGMSQKTLERIDTQDAAIDTRERLILRLIVGVEMGLRKNFDTEEARRAWLHSVCLNSLFGGYTPLSFLMKEKLSMKRLVLEYLRNLSH